MWLPELVDRELLFVDIGVLLGRRRFRLPVCCGAFFYLEEVQGANKISKWLVYFLLTIFGILLLSYEHHEK